MIWRVGQSIQMIQNWDKCLTHPVCLCRLEKWANRNAMKVEKRKCESSTWRRIIVFTKVGVTGWKEDLQRILWVLVNNKLEVCPCARTSWTAWSVASRLRAMIFPLCSTHLESSVQFWGPQNKRIMNIEETVSERPLRCSRNDSISPMSKVWESWDCSAWRTEGSGEISLRRMNTWWGE